MSTLLTISPKYLGLGKQTERTEKTAAFLNVIMITVNCFGSEQVSNLAVIIRQTVKNICMNR